jgi:hypothetical protein
MMLQKAINWLFMCICILLLSIASCASKEKVLYPNVAPPDCSKEVCYGILYDMNVNGKYLGQWNASKEKEDSLEILVVAKLTNVTYTSGGNSGFIEHTPCDNKDVVNISVASPNHLWKCSCLPGDLPKCFDCGG